MVVRSLVAALAAAAIANAPAHAAVVTRHDANGRAISFDVRARGVDVAWYARILRRAPHGAEIQDVLVRIVPRSAIARLCGSGFGSCYEPGREGGTITVPAGSGVGVEHAVLHEYGHHVMATYAIATWWRARQIDGLRARGAVADDYSLGWKRSIDEIFAEDYVQLTLRTTYAITWLPRPGAVVKAAIRRDIRDGIPVR
jgi:hypothetical protein